MGINLVSLLVGASILLTKTQVSGIVLNLTMIFAIATAIFLSLLILLCVKREWTLKIIDSGIKLIVYLSRGRWKPTKIREDAIKGAALFHDSMEAFGHTPKTLFASLTFSAISYIFTLGVAYLVFLSMEYPIHWGEIIVTYSIMFAIQGIPLGVPFEAGLPEITMTTLFIMLGVPPKISATATILTRILTLWLKFFIGFTVQQWLEIKAITVTNTGSKTEKA